MADDSANWALPRWWAVFIVLPFVAFVAVNLLLSQWGSAAYAVAQPYRVDGHLEATGRLRTFATFVLFASFAVGVCLYALRIVLPLGRPVLHRIGIAYLLTALIGSSIAIASGVTKGDSYLEDRFACASLGFIGPAAAAAPPADAPPPRVTAEELDCPARGDGFFAIPARQGDDPDYFRQLRILYTVAAVLLFLGTPAVVWGAVACLALPAAPDPQRSGSAWEDQTRRLNGLLYLTAAFLISGLFFSSARLNWPAYSLHPADAPAYAEHVRSFVLYLGVLNSVLIASIYLPVAAALAARKPAGSSPPAADATEAAAVFPAEQADPWAVYKTALTILSPAILALLGELLKFTP